MRIPYVVDNESHRLADVLNAVLAEHTGKALDVATAYFNVQGFRLLRPGLLGLGSFRLLLGDEPTEGANVGLRPRGAIALGAELNAAPFSEELLRAVEDLIAFLRRPGVAVRAYQGGFLHAKAYIFYGDRPSAGWDRFQPVAAIVGSSNFTGPGLTTNRELNLAHKAVLADEELDDDPAASFLPSQRLVSPAAVDPEQKRLWKSAVGARAIADLDAWFEAHWAAARDFKADLIDLLDASKFGAREYTPYQVYMKALFEYFRADLDQQPGATTTRSAVDLAEFQEDAVKKARKILARYDGVLIGDSVGLGMDPRSVAEFRGHADPTLVMRTYAHVKSGHAEKSAKLLAPYVALLPAGREGVRETEITPARTAPETTKRRRPSVRLAACK